MPPELGIQATNSELVIEEQIFPIATGASLVGFNFAASLRLGRWKRK
jgi:hypothetical protein